MPVPVADRGNMAGTLVVLECEGVWILLAHMRRGSVLVAKGHDARLGDPVGQVGNSGNSGEPHLHLHVQRPGTDSMPFGAEPIPLTIAGRYLVRGQRVRW
jgi:septal ring factor EnvC (AmiA/AmiB activator)